MLGQGTPAGTRHRPPKTRLLTWSVSREIVQRKTNER